MLTTADGWKIHRVVQPGVGTIPCSYDRHGTCFGLEPPARFCGARVALDVEALDTPLPPMLFSSSGCGRAVEFWVRWTRTEVAAKLFDMPIAAWLRTYGLLPADGRELLRFFPSLRLRTLLTPSHVMSFGCRVEQSV